MTELTPAPRFGQVRPWLNRLERDLGAGVGPLLAGALLPLLPAWLLYGGAAVLLAASAARIGARRG